MTDITGRARAGMDQVSGVRGVGRGLCRALGVFVFAGLLGAGAWGQTTGTVAGAPVTTAGEGTRNPGGTDTTGTLTDVGVTTSSEGTRGPGGAAETTGTSAAAKPMKPMKVIVAKVNDLSINPVTARFIVNAIERGEREEAVVIIRLDTPGGLLQSTREIVKAQLGAKTPVVTYVAPDGSRAASAGMFVTIASHIAAMAPGTHLGAATPVDMSGKGRLFRKNKKGDEEKEDGATTGTEVASADGATTVVERGKARRDVFGGADAEEEGAEDEDDIGDAMSNKVMNDTLAWVENIAKLRGRNAEWARSAVAEAKSSTAERALKLGVIDVIAEDTAELLAAIDGKTVKLPGGREVVLRTAGSSPETIELTTRESILNVLASPEIAYLLLLAGLAGLFYEVTHPGLMIPGIFGAVALLLAALGLQMLPTNYAAVLLIMAGLALIIAEVKFTMFGLLAMAGVVCLMFGSLALIERPLPGFTGLSTPLVVTVSGTTAILLGTLAALVARAHSRKPAMGEESFVGQFAEVVMPLSPEGKVFFEGTLWNAVSLTPVPVGARVRVVAIDRLRLLVEPLDAPLAVPSGIGRGVGGAGEGGGPGRLRPS